MRNWHEAHVEKQSAGDRIADRVATFIGSWAFIIGQTGVMTVWILVNTLALFGLVRFDEYSLCRARHPTQRWPACYSCRRRSKAFRSLQYERPS
jgi:hypothetical protein